MIPRFGERAMRVACINYNRRLFRELRLFSGRAILASKVKMKPRKSNQRMPSLKSTASREESRLLWQQLLKTVLNEFLYPFDFYALKFASELQQVNYDAHKAKFVGKFSGSSNRVRSVEIGVLIEDETGDLNLFPDCRSCRSAFDSFCVHTYLMLKRIFEEFSDRNSPLVAEVLGPPEPAWKIALQAIDNFLKQEQAEPKIEQQFDSTTRLAWRIMIGGYAGLTIYPVLQTIGKRGNWNKGRITEWYQINSKSDLALSVADREILRRLSAGAYGFSDNKNDETLDQLIGHPLVFVDDMDGRHCHVQVKKCEVGIEFKQDAENWHLVPTMGGRTFTEFDFYRIVAHSCGVAGDLANGELFVAQSSREIWKLIEQFLQEKPTIPPEAHAELTNRLPRLESRVSIVLPDSMKGDRVDPDRRLTLRLTRLNSGGCLLEMLVRPAPAGKYFCPADGPIEVSGSNDEGRVHVMRDVSDELARANALVKELFLQRFASKDSHTWQIETDDEVLDLLDSVYARNSDDPLVIWSEDKSSARMDLLGEISPQAIRIEINDQRDWFGLSGTIEIGGRAIPLATLLAALKGGRRFLDLGDGQFATISRELRDRLDRISDMIHSNRGKMEFNTTAAPALADLFEDHVTVNACKKWKESLKRLKRASELEPVLPATLTAELRDYQLEGYKWLRRLSEWGMGGCLADDMGLGKTVQAIAVLLDRREHGPTLIAAPVSVGFNWVREVERFAPTLRPILYRDTDRSDFLKSLGAGDLLITSYHLLQQHARELASVKWGTLVLDEAQAVKNSQTKTAKVVREIAADWRLALTGTPVENHLGELWGLFRVIAPGLFGGLERFREVFADPIEKSNDANRRHALSGAIRPFILRRTKSEVLKELPARTEILLTAELSKPERRLYEDARLWAITQLSEAVEESDGTQRFQVLAAMTKLRQLACHPRLVDKSWQKSSAKLDLFLETINELREGRHRALVFSQFTQHLAIIREALDDRGIVYQYLDGSTAPGKRQVAVDAFQRGEGDLFLISLKAGGTGLNLTAADYVVHLDPWWNPAVEDQATDRTHRIGQTRPVTVYRLVAKETIEEQILKLHADKRGLVSGILEGTDAAAKLSTLELVELIKSAGKV